MSNVITDEKRIEQLLRRGVDEVIDFEHLRKRLLSGEKLRVKLGIDPTSPNIHIGRAVLLWKLREFQDLGHRAVFIVGDFTGQIGDTSDKEAERPMLSEVEIKRNMKTYFNQAYKILNKRDLETHYNSKWLKRLGFIEIGKMADKFGLHELISRELIRKRLDAGRRVSLRENLYPLMQGYDSVAIKADVELGGTDQRFNLLAGREIQPLYGQRAQDVVIVKFPLLGPDGRKMSSSWGNVINITDDPNNMFGKIMSINDDLIIHYFEMATKLPIDSVKKIEENLKMGENPKNTKLYLAKEIVKIYYNENEAEKAKKEWERVFSQKELPENIKKWPIQNDKSDIVSVIVDSGLADSRTEAKRLVDQEAVRVNDNVVKNWDYEVKTGDVLKVGSRKFLQII